MILAAAEANTMTAGMAMDILFKVVGGLGVFLLGMKYMSEGLQTIAGSRLRRLIGAVTNNRLMATGVGTAVTTLIQSSSVTTVMVVGFVNAGFMTLSQAIGVIMGANIGTTITGWILVLKIGIYGLPLLGVSALVYRFAKRERWRYIAMVAMGLGMVFFGLELMKNGFKPIRGLDGFDTWFSLFSAASYWGVLKCAAVGCILTLIVQSSSATLGITIGLASTGVIPFETAAALVLGENIGTTITAFLASLGTTTNAKRAAYAHVIFNVLGVVWVTALFSPFIWFVTKFMGLSGVDPYNVVHVTAGIATVHTIFNVTNTLLFLPLTNYLAAFLTWVVPEKAYKEAPHLTHLDGRLAETPEIGIEQSRIEILRMGEMVKKMLGRLRESIGAEDMDDRIIKKIFHAEEVLDIMQREVVVFLTELMTDSLSYDTAETGREQLRIADEYESISDYVTNILKLYLRLHKTNKRFPSQDQADIQALHDEVAAYFDLVHTGYQHRHKDIVSKAHTRSVEITHRVRELRDSHLTGMRAVSAEPLVVVIYTDVLNAYRRVKDHSMNVAEALAGGK